MKLLRKILSPAARLYDRLTGPELAIRLYGKRTAAMQKQPVMIAEAREILVVRLDEIGDMVMTAPLLRALRESAPQAKITLVVKPYIHNLFETCPYIDRLLAHEPGANSRTNRVPRLQSAARFARENLGSGQTPDFAIMPRWDIDDRGAVAVGFLSGAARRVSYSEAVTADKEIVNRSQDRLLTDALATPDDSQHEVQRTLHVLASLGGSISTDALELWPTEEDKNSARALLSGIPSRWIALGVPGGASPLKAWPADRYVTLAQSVKSEEVGFVLVGGENDVPLCASVAKQIAATGRPVVNAAGQLTLRQTAALLAQCSLYAGSDSGPMHMAAAMNVPVIALFGSSCPHRFHPWTPKREVIHVLLPCGPCAVNDRGSHADRCVRCIFPVTKCMHGISVESVAAAVNQALLLDAPETIR